MKYLAVVVLLASGCAGSQVVVRDLATYRNEVKFLAAASTQEADAMQAVMALPEACKCEGEGEDRYWTTPECETAADLIQTVRVRVPYHVAMMLFLAGDTEDRPPKDPPPIPKATEICP